MYKKLIKTQTTDTDTRNPITVNIQAAGSLALLNVFPVHPARRHETKTVKTTINRRSNALRFMMTYPSSKEVPK
jgi:hypothetical protein